MSKFVAIEAQGVVRVHLPHTTGNYDTLCGLDANDPGVQHFPASVPKGAKVDCPDCKAIWAVAKCFRATDFT